MKNLEIESMRLTFFLVIYSFEFIAFSLWSFCNIYEVFGSNQNEFYEVVVELNENDSCILQHPTKLGFGNYVANLIVTIIPILIILFLIVLKRACYSYPYTKIVRRFSMYILLRSVFLMLTKYFFISSYFARIFLLPFAIVDYYLLITSSWNFYRMLKGRKNELRSNTSEQEYKEKKIAFRSFTITQPGTIFALTLCITMVIMNSVSDCISLLLSGDCIIHYIFPDIAISYNVPISIRNSGHKISDICLIIRSCCTIIVSMLIFLSNLFILIYITRKMFIRRQQFKNINPLIIRPLLEDYWYQVENYRSFRKSRPYIQYIRSN